jgi:hypothetical protein
MYHLGPEEIEIGALLQVEDWFLLPACRSPCKEELSNSLCSALCCIECWCSSWWPKHRRGLIHPVLFHSQNWSCVILQNCSLLNSSTMIFLLFWLLPAFSFFYELWGFFVLGFFYLRCTHSSYSSSTLFTTSDFVGGLPNPGSQVSILVT